MSQLFHIIRWTVTLFSSLTVSYRLICCFCLAFIALTSNRELVACIGTHSFIDFSLELKTFSYQTWRAIFRGNFRVFGTNFLCSYFFSNLHNILLMIFELFFQIPNLTLQNCLFFRSFCQSISQFLYLFEIISLHFRVMSFQSCQSLLKLLLHLIRLIPSNFLMIKQTL